MPQPSYSYAAAHVFALETKLISRDRLERMVDAPSAVDAYKMLTETEYGNNIADISNPHNYERLLSKEIQKTYDLIDSISPNPDITALFFLKYDFHNLKVLLKARHLGKKQDELLVGGGTLPINVMEEALKSRDYRALPSYIARTIEELDESMSIKVDPRKIVLALDRAMYEHIFDVCSNSKNTFVFNYFTMQVDLVNIRSFIRISKIGETFDFFKEVFLPNGKLDIAFFEKVVHEPLEQLTDQLAFSEYAKLVQQGLQDFLKTDTLMVFERLMDDFLLNYIRNARWNPLGLEPVIGYILAKENEIRLIRMIMVGKINNIPAAKIRERLRDVYV